MTYALTVRLQTKADSSATAVTAGITISANNVPRAPSLVSFLESRRPFCMVIWQFLLGIPQFLTINPLARTPGHFAAVLSFGRKPQWTCLCTHTTPSHLIKDHAHGAERTLQADFSPLGPGIFTPTGPGVLVPLGPGSLGPFGPLRLTLILPFPLTLTLPLPFLPFCFLSFFLAFFFLSIGAPIGCARARNRSIAHSLSRTTTTDPPSP